MNTARNQQATSLQMFYNEDANVSIRMEVIDGEPWFVAKDVAMALDIAWSGQTLSRISDKWKGMINLITPSSGTRGGGTQQLSVINEPAMYKLAFRSNKPEADRFVNWIVGDVLPSIRRTGSYSSNGVQSPVEEQSKKLPLPKFRPGFAEWKEKVKCYLSEDEVLMIVKKLHVTYKHIRKVYAGTAVSERVARALNDAARYNYDHGIVYPEERPVYEQLSLEWEEQECEPCKIKN